MTKTLLRAGGLACALLTCTALTAPAMAQSAPPPRFNQLDANGVDVVTGDFFFSLTEGLIGSGAGELSLVRNWAGPAGWTDNWSGTLYLRGSDWVVEFGRFSDTFTLSGSTYTSTKANGATLVSISEGYLYTASDGTQITFKLRPSTSLLLFTGPACQRSGNGECAIPVSIQRPNGMTYALTWDQVERCFERFGQACTSGGTFVRLKSVANSANYSLTLNYATDTPGSGAPVSGWYDRTSAAFTNLDSAPSTLPTVTYSTASNVTDVTDIGGRTWRFTLDSNGRLAGIRRPGASADTTAISYSGAVVTSVVNEGVTTNYSRSVSGTTATLTATETDGDSGTTDPVTTFVSDLTKGRPTSIADPLSRTTDFQYDSSARPTRVTLPEGNYAEYAYDARGNVTEARQVAKSGSGLPDLVTTASYDSSCSNPVTCNLPNSVTDARGNTTEFTYNATHGGLLTATSPAPSGSGDRPQTRYSYAQVTAVTGQPVYLPTEISSCASGTAAGSPSCVGTADESRTVIAYDTDNLRVTSVTRRAGDNSVSATDAFAYDEIGNLLTVDGPLSGNADTTRFRYNSAGQLIGAIGPDPDGAGALKHRAQRATYVDGLPTKIEIGTVNSQSDSDWTTGFTSLEAVEQDYDSHSRPIVSRLVSGTTTYALTQTSYDGFGRLSCVAQRMNPSEFAGLPSDACTLDTQGSYGPDRITRTSYDLASQVTKVETGVGVTGVAADEVTATYRNNGQSETVTDANGNKTTYVYDGHDRLSRTRMPDPSTAGTSSTSDYEELTYLTATVGGSSRSTPLVASRRLRDGSSITFAYDNLNRPTDVTRPNSERSQAFEYDLLNRLTDADQTNASIDYAWDALGRLTSHIDGGFGTTSFLYDAAGRRIRMTWPDNFYVTYDYDVAGDVTALKESGSTSLASFTYDDRGRRTLLTRGNGTTTAYDYDDVSRLEQLVQNLDGSGTSNDLTLDFTRNPAGQIVSNVRSNNGYSFTGHANIHLAPSIDGLNRIVNTGFGYDARGNLTSDPGGWAPGHAAGSYTYDSSNRLTSGGGQSFYYDPAGRLFAQANTGGYTYFLNSGDQMIGEYNSSGVLQRRFVHGPGIDEPLVWYEGSGTSTRRYFHADERGSVVAVSDNSGNLHSNINRYDEYGVPQGTLTGRFGYTGQMWLPEVGLYHYRARAYNPGLGRFMQTDPIGVDSGMNLYAYVGGDPLNWIDPEGLLPRASGTFRPDVPVAGGTVGPRGGGGTFGGGGATGSWDGGGTFRGGGATGSWGPPAAGPVTSGPSGGGATIPLPAPPSPAAHAPTPPARTPSRGPVYSDTKERIFTIPETRVLTSLLGDRVAGAQDLMARLKDPNYRVPVGVTVDLVQRYLDFITKLEKTTNKPMYVQEARREAMQMMMNVLNGSSKINDEKVEDKIDPDKGKLKDDG